MRHHVLQLAVLTIVYIVFARLGLLLATVHGNVSPVWPASGVAVAGCLLGGVRMLPAVFLGALINNALTEIPLWASLLIAAGNALEALVGARVLEHFRGRLKNSIQLGETVGVVLSSLLAPLPSALLGVTALWLVHPLHQGKVLELLATWWTGDATGILCLLPSLLAVAGTWRSYRKPDLQQLMRAAALAAIGLLTCWLMFFKSYGTGFLFTAGPVLMLAVAWFGSPGVKLSALVLSILSVVATACGAGPFVGPELNQNLMQLQAFLSALSLTALILPQLRSAGDLRLPATILLIGWTLSGWFVSSIQQAQALKEEQDFLQLTGEIRLEIQQRLEACEDAMHGGAGLFKALGGMKQKAWQDYVGALDLRHRFPGVNALGITQPVREEDKEPFLRARREDGQAGFEFKAIAGEVLPSTGTHFIVSHIEPALANAPVLGLDNASENQRKRTFESARDSGLPRMSGRLLLTQQGTGRNGFLHVLPVYKEEESLGDPEARRSALQAWVFATFSTETFFDAIMARHARLMDLTLYEGASPDSDRLLYGRLPAGGPVRLMRLELGGKRLTAQWTRPQGYAPGADKGLLVTASSLAIITLLLASVVMSIQGTGRKAREIAGDLTRELKRARDELEDASRFQSAVLNGTHYSIIATRLDGIIEIFNTGAQAMLGYSEREMIGQTPAVFHDPGEVVARARQLTSELGREVPPGFEAFVALTREGKTDQREWTYLRKDGTRIPVLLSVSALRGADGAITGFLGIAYDLSERKLAEERQQASHTRLQSIFSTINEGLVLQDAQGTILECNASAERILGLSREQMSGRTSLDPRWAAIHEDGSPFPGSTHPAAVSLRTLQAQSGVIMGVHKPDGTLTWISINSEPLLAADGGLRGVVSSFVDISQRREQERLLKDSLTEVGHLRSALDEHCIVAFTDPRGVITFVNDKLCRISKYQRAELLGKDNRMLNSSYHSREFFRDLWSTVQRGHVWKGEIRNKAKDGSLYWVETSIVPFMGEKGRPSQFIVISTDITARKKLDEDLLTARDQALESSRLKSEFLATMSHEIRTPMNGIMGMSGLLMDTRLDSHQKDMGRVIQNCAENLLAIINDILDFSKIESGKLNIELADFRLRNMVEDCLAAQAGKAHEKRVELTCDFDQALALRLRGDEFRIRQVLTNLIGNAVKFTEKGEVNVSVRLMGEDRGRLHARFMVCDSGIGIPRKAQPILFQPFTQVDGSVTRRYGGTGLGLAISRRLVELMKGELKFESEEGKGSVFWFDLDLEKSSDQSSAEPADVLIPRAEVLVVDDNDTNRKILAGQLRHAGLECAEAPGAREGLSMLRERLSAGKPVQLVLLDWCMPDKNGLELAAEIRADPALAGTKLIMLSSASPFIDTEQVGSVRFEAFLTKPVREGQLKATIARVLSSERGTETPAPAPQKPAANRKRSLHILMAEDNPANQAVGQMVLEKMGHRVDIVDNGEKALQRLPLEAYDLVLMDCQMPILDGFEATRRIRAGKVRGANPQIPVIALTAYAMAEDRLRCANAGMTDHVTKPISQAALEEAISHCGVFEQSPAEKRPALTTEAEEPAEKRSTELLDMKVIQDMRSLPGRRGPSLLPELIDSFLGDENKRLASIRQLAAGRQGPELAATAHKLAGSCSYLGAKEARATALAMEAAALTGRWEEAEAKLASLVSQWPRLCETLNKLKDGQSVS